MSHERKHLQGSTSTRLFRLWRWDHSLRGFKSSPEQGDPLMSPTPSSGEKPRLFTGEGLSCLHPQGASSRVGIRTQGSPADILISLHQVSGPCPYLLNPSYMLLVQLISFNNVPLTFSTKPAPPLPLKPCSELCSWWSSEQIHTKLPSSPQSLVTLAAQGCSPMGDHCFFSALVSFPLSQVGAGGAAWGSDPSVTRKHTVSSFRLRVL